jgi:hypothetical protein
VASPSSIATRPRFYNTCDTNPERSYATSHCVTQKFDDLLQVLKKYLDAQGTFVWESLTGGRKFHDDKDSTTDVSGAARVEHHEDLCAAKLTLDKVVRLDESLSMAGVRQGTLFYTYHVTVMP